MYILTLPKQKFEFYFLLCPACIKTKTITTETTVNFLFYFFLFFYFFFFLFLFFLFLFQLLIFQFKYRNAFPYQKHLCLQVTPNFQCGSGKKVRIQGRR